MIMRGKISIYPSRNRVGTLRSKRLKEAPVSKGLE
jgi:hypothetical protein